MKILREWITQLRGRKETSYPFEVLLSEVNEVPLKFRVYSSVERFRVVDYGGEKEFLTELLSSLKPDDIMFDIGASVGLVSVCAAARLTRGKVYAFEPDVENRLRLAENIRLNSLENISILDWAVTDSEGEMILYSDGAAGYAPSLVQQTIPNSPKGQIVVKTGSIDARLSRSELPVPDVMKIDIEGAEGLCLKGCQDLLNSRFGGKPRLIFLELHPAFLPGFNTTPESVRSLITSAGYKLLWTHVRNAQEHLCYQDKNYVFN